MNLSIRINPDAVEVRLLVKASFVVTTGMHGGPLSASVLGALVSNQIVAAGGIEEFFDEVSIDKVEVDRSRMIIKEIA